MDAQGKNEMRQSGYIRVTFDWALNGVWTANVTLRVECRANGGVWGLFCGFCGLFFVGVGVLSTSVYRRLIWPLFFYPYSPKNKCWIIPYSDYLVYLHKIQTIMAETKVIWVHLIWEKKDYFFGSISAIYDVLTEEQIGITKSSLLHAGMRDGSSHLTKRALIKQSRLIRTKKQG